MKPIEPEFTKKGFACLWETKDGNESLVVFNGDGTSKEAIFINRIECEKHALCILSKNDLIVQVELQKHGVAVKGVTARVFRVLNLERHGEVQLEGVEFESYSTKTMKLPKEFEKPVMAAIKKVTSKHKVVYAQKSAV